MSDGPKHAGPPRHIRQPGAGTRVPTRNELQKAFGPDGRLAARELVRLALHAKDESVRVKALAIAAPYMWKKQADRLEVTGANGAPLEVHDHFVGIALSPIVTAAPLNPPVVEALVLPPATSASAAWAADVIHQNINVAEAAT